MSRCFPFPPPGYEKKARPDDDANILKKEKHKEKKHKKDKDREKKEKKEKKDKEKGGERNGEKKERKRKRKEEKKDSEAKKTVGSSSHRHDEKLGSVGIQVDQTHQDGLLLELEKGVGKWNGPEEFKSLDKINFKEFSVKSSENELGSNHPSKKQRIVEETVHQDKKASKKRKEKKDKSKHKHKKDGDRERKSKSKDKKEKKAKKMEGKVNEVATPMQTKLIVNGHNSVDIQHDRWSYPFHGSSSNNGCLGRRKEPEMNGFVHDSENPISKVPRQNGIRDDATNHGIRFVMEIEAAEHKFEGRTSNSSSAPENGTKLDNHAAERREAINNNHHKGFESISTPQTQTSSSLLMGRKLELEQQTSQSGMDCARKEQVMVTNYKLNKKVLSGQPIAENGRKLESSQQPCTFPSAERKGAISKPKFDNDQEVRSNGIGVRKADACSKRPPGQRKESVENHLKPPHPDAKFLTEILSIPKVEWSDMDDLSWLYPKEDQVENKCTRVSTKVEEPKEVWAEALHLESADITALPYVIPY